MSSKQNREEESDQAQQSSVKRPREDNSDVNRSQEEEKCQPQAKKTKMDNVPTKEDYNFAKPLSIPKKMNEKTASTNSIDIPDAKNIDEETERMQFVFQIIFIVIMRCTYVYQMLKVKVFIARR